MLLPWPGTRSLPSTWRVGKGEPDAKRHLPLVCLLASSKVHSDLLLGLERGKIIGRSLSSAIRCKSCGVKAPPMVDRPIKIVGLTCSTTSSSDLYCLPPLSSREKYFLCSASSPDLSSVTKPFESTSQKHRLAWYSVRPSFMKKATICLATPTPADPAPRKTARCSFVGTPDCLTALITPARITAPVP